MVGLAPFLEPAVLEALHGYELAHAVLHVVEAGEAQHQRTHLVEAIHRNVQEPEAAVAAAHEDMEHRKGWQASVEAGCCDV